MCSAGAPSFELFAWIGDEKVEEVILYELKAGTEMTSNKKPADEEELFRTAMSDVRPLRSHNRSPIPRKLPEARPRQLLLDEASVLDELLSGNLEPEDLETGEELLYLRPGYPQRLLRRLRGGHYSSADSIDLHQMSEKTAREVLLHFLEQARRQNFGCVHVVHGKGLRSRGKPKLKQMTNHVLRRHPAVIAFASCRAVEGGTGAVNVLLDPARKASR